MQTIAVPYDFSEYAEAALDFATQISKKSDAKIKLIHVIEYPLATTFNVTGEIEADDNMDQIFTLELIKKTNERLKNTLSQHQDANIEKVVLMGSAYDGIIDQLKELEVDLIVMGTKGATGLKELLVGSNTEKIVRNAHCPVIAIHEKCDLEKINKVLYATDLDDSHNKVLQEFKSYQKLLGAKIHLVWIDTPYNTINKDLALDRLREIAIKNELTNYEVHVIKAMKPEEGILSYSWQAKADMIAMSTHSHKGLLHLFVGSIAEDVVNHSNLPVWTYTIK